jgi:hypothetical protein
MLRISQSSHALVNIHTRSCKSRAPKIYPAMDLILDIQGFGRFSDKFILKELAAISIQVPDENVLSITRLLFKPPCSWVTLPRECKNLNTWLTRNYHGIPWNVGEIPHKDVDKVVKKVADDARYICVKGLEKKRWVEKILNDESKFVIDLEELGCPSFRVLQYESRVIHWHGDDHGNLARYRCAFENVQRMKSWYMKDCTASLHKSLNMYIQVGGLKQMKAEDIAFLTKDFILIYGSSIIDEVWDKLSEAMKKDEDIAACRRCRLHYNSAEINADDPIPMIRDCSQCKLSQ